MCIALAGCGPREENSTQVSFPGSFEEVTTLQVPVPSDDQRIAEAFRTRASGIFVQSRGTVERILSDDLDPPRHQRFILRLATGQTLLMTHNIDLAPRIENLRAGDSVGFRGEYVWNDKGGLIHWTHHDPSGRRVGGWLEHEGRKHE